MSRSWLNLRAMRKATNQNVTLKHRESALRFAVILNLWLPIVGQIYFSTISDLIFFIVIPFLALVYFYYILALKIEVFRGMVTFKISNILLIIGMLLLSCIMVYVLQRPISLILIEIFLIIVLYTYYLLNKNIK